ncbi:hypothetical protein DL96DRAFT_1572086 [Flagelloscypha sp. PMI_526]|nr:hypothetical protein DL96DRAFT_1572086 [Flagelloscypha sp. PMI_526]
MYPHQGPFALEQGRITTLDELVPPNTRTRTNSERTEASIRQIHESVSRIHQVRRKPSNNSITTADDSIIDAMDFDPRLLVPDPEWEFDSSSSSSSPGRSIATTRRSEASMAPTQRPTSLPPLAPIDTLTNISERERARWTENAPQSPAPLHATRRSVLESLIRPIALPSASSPDDPNTLLGQRIAAREAAGAGTTAPATNETSLRVSDMRTDLEQFGRLIRQRRAESAALLDLTTSGRRSVDVQAGSSPAADSPHTSSPSVRSPLSANPAAGAPWRSSRFFGPARERERSGSSIGSVETRQNSGQSTGRLSLLSNFGSIQNLASPLSATTGRPLLFEDQATFVDEPLSLAAPAAPLAIPAPEGGPRQTDTVLPRRRSYSTSNRRFPPTPSGDEFVQSISSANFMNEWEEAELERLLAESQNLSELSQPSAEPTIVQIDEQRRRLVEAQRQLMNSPLRRRQGVSRRLYTFRRDANSANVEDGSNEQRAPRAQRGWVRLDPDGNEIDTPAEFEAERQARVDTFSSFLGASRSPPSPRTIVSPSENSPMTRTQPSFDDDSAAPPRVRLASSRASANLRQNYAATMESLYGGHSSTRLLKQSELAKPLAGVVGSTTEYKPGLLPMPVEDMVDERRCHRSEGGMLVVTNKVFAGR